MEIGTCIDNGVTGGAAARLYDGATDRNDYYKLVLCCFRAFRYFDIDSRELAQPEWGP
jgi:hypothetical protein